MPDPSLCLLVAAKSAICVIKRDRPSNREHAHTQFFLITVINTIIATYVWHVCRAVGVNLLRGGRWGWEGGGGGEGWA